MAYNNIETSRDSGKPIYLYEFRLEDRYWRYTSADSRIPLGTDIWEPLGIDDDGIKQTGEAKTDALSITMPNSSPVVGMFIGVPPSQPVGLTIRHYHHGDDEAIVCYVGQVTTVNMSTPQTAKVTCATLSATMDRDGLRTAWSRGCQHALYDAQCRVDKEKYRVDARVKTVGGGIVTSDAFAQKPDGYFSGGFIEWLDPNYGTERRGIESHSGDSIQLFNGADGVSGGLMLKTYPGCGRTTEVCDTVFNNLPNYGGCPSLPDRSPFDGNPLF